MTMPFSKRHEWFGSTARLTLLAAVAVLPAAPSFAERNSNSQEIWSGKSDRFVVEWRAGDLRVKSRDRNGPLLLSFRAIAQAEWGKIVKAGRGAPLAFEKSYRLLSFFGPYLSVEEETDCECGGAH